MAVTVVMATSFIAATLVILAMLPATSRPHNPSPNLLFFGAFALIPEEEFQGRMEELLQDEHKLHRAMVHDIYQLGQVLQNKKYKRLGQAYRVFFYGLMLSGLLLLVEAGWKALRP